VVRPRDVEGDVGSGIARSDEEHITRPELAGIPVLARMQLHDAGLERLRESRDPACLVHGHGDHDMIGLEPSAAGIDDVADAVARHAIDPDVRPHGKGELLRV
jgi:hypothetical protein